MFTDFTFEGAEGICLAGTRAGHATSPALIYLHGGGQTRHSWRGAMEATAKHGYQVVSYDARGHGDSGWSPSGDYSVGALAMDLAALLVSVATPFALIGASMGGITSLTYCGTVEKPMPEALVLVDIVPRPAKKGLDEVMSFMTANPNGFASVEEARAAVARYNPRRTRATSNDNLARNLRERGGRFYWHWDPKILDLPGDGGLERLMADLERHSRSVRIPTCLLRGAESAVVDDKGVDALLAMIPHAEVWTIEKAGHMIAGDQNNAFGKSISDFADKTMPLPL